MQTYFINYILNKFCPYFIIIMVLYLVLGFTKPLVYIIIPFIIFIDRFSFKAGYSMAYCRREGYDLEE